jgi:hypothetical protein
MNGRVYDPALGRFLSPDPVVQAPYDTQGQNRYAYVRNNPLRYTDPSGYSCVGHPAGDQFAQQCMENILTQATRLLADWQLAWFGDAALQASLNGAMSEAGSVVVPQTPDVPLENFVVTGTRPPEIPPVSIDVTNYANPGLIRELGGSVLRWRYFDEAALLVGGMLALVEPTPAGEIVLATGGARSVATPYGNAVQSLSAAATTARSQVEGGATLWRMGTMGRSAAGEAQFWSLERPFAPGFATRMGIPPANVANFNFVESATLRPGSPFITRVAPGFGTNVGGGIEVVVPEGGVLLRYFGTL